MCEGVTLDTKSLMPSYWERDAAESSETGFAVHSIPSPSDPRVSHLRVVHARREWNSLKACLATQGDWLGFGKDVREEGRYTSLELCKAWRIENGSLCGKYRYAQDEITKEMSRVKKENSGELRGLDNVSLQAHTQTLPGSPHLRRDLNECYLLHGTRPEVVMNLVAGGLNERFSKVGAFGNGNYFAEDAGKTDQYVIRDPGFKCTDEVGSLHDALYNGDPSEYPNEDVFYLLLCRVTMGAYVRTKRAGGGVSALKQLDRPSENVFPDHGQTRELPPIHKVSSHTLYHGLLVESSATVEGGDLRYREFVNFHREFSYPEYILAYMRKS